MNETPQSAPDMRVHKKTRSVSLANTIAIVMLTGIVAFVAGNRSPDLLTSIATKSDAPASLDFSSLNDVYRILRSKYDGELDPNKLIDGAKHGLVEATGDPYTVYFNDEEAAEFQGDLDGSFEGIGAELGKRDGNLVVISTLDASPAKKSGLQAGDTIIKVNNDETTDWTVEKAVSKIRGEKGTTVKLTIVRDKSEVKEISITRDAITNPSVRSEITADNIGILRISRFGETDTAQLSRLAAEKFAQSKVKGVIVDLRGNGGGYLEAARDVAGLWLEDKVVVTERVDGKVTDTLRSGNDAPLKGIKTIVLVNGGSASASEILAGALADNGAAELVGEQTYGKGSVQTVISVKSGGEVKVTIAKWYTPNGKNISKEGIKPKYVVERTDKDFEKGNDPQKDKALELLR